MGTHEEIRFTEASLKKAADVLAKMLQTNIRMRMDAKGFLFPKGVTLQDSGEFIRSISGELINGLASAAVKDPKAAFLEERYHFLGLAPSTVDKLIAKLQPILAKGAYFASQGAR